MLLNLQIPQVMVVARRTELFTKEEWIDQDPKRTEETEDRCCAYLIHTVPSETGMGPEGGT